MCIGHDTIVFDIIESKNSLWFGKNSMVKDDSGIHRESVENVEEKLLHGQF